MEYLALALKFEEKQRRDSQCLKRQCCEALSRLAVDQSYDRHNAFLQYQFDGHDLWVSLEAAMDQEDCAGFVLDIKRRMRGYYYYVVRRNQLTALPVDCYSAIITFIW